MLYDKKDAVDWEQYYPPSEFKKQGPITLKPGGVYAFVSDGGRGVWRCRRAGTDDPRGTLLARSSPATSNNTDDYGISSRFFVAVLQEPGGRLRSPREAYGVGPDLTGRRQVSQNGHDWVDYDSLTDSDAFESYAHQRMAFADGTAPRLLTKEKGNNKHDCEHDGCVAQIPLGDAFCFAHHVRRETVAGDHHPSAKQKRPELFPDVLGRPPVGWSHPTMFGGVWTLR